MKQMTFEDFDVPPREHTLLSIRQRQDRAWERYQRLRSRADWLLEGYYCTEPAAMALRQIDRGLAHRVWHALMNAATLRAEMIVDTRYR